MRALTPFVDVVATALAFGSGIVAVRASMGDAEPGTVILARCGLAALVITAMLIGRVAILAYVRDHFVLLTLIAVLTVITPLIAFSYALQWITAGSLGILLVLRPILTAAAATITRQHARLDRRVAFGLALGLGGAALLAYSPGADGAPRHLALLGQLLALVGVASASLGSIVIQARVPRNSSGSATLGALLIAFALLLVVSPFAGWLQGIAVTGPSAWLPIVYSGAVGTGIAYWLLIRTVQRHGAMTASTEAYLEPGITLGLGALLLGEQLTTTKIVAAALAITGVALVTRRPPPLANASKVA